MFCIGEGGGATNFLFIRMILCVFIVCLLPKIWTGKVF